MIGAVLNVLLTSYDVNNKYFVRWCGRIMIFFYIEGSGHNHYHILDWNYPLCGKFMMKKRIVCLWIRNRTSLIVGYA